MLAVRDAIPKACDLASAELSTLRSRFIKIAARVIESAGRLRIAFAAGCSEAPHCVLRTAAMSTWRDAVAAA